MISLVGSPFLEARLGAATVFDKAATRYASSLVMPRPLDRNQRGTDGLVELSVERLGAQGDGIGERGGEPVFLPFTVPGDRVRAQLGARRGGGREGRVVEWLDAGKGRAEPPCAHFGRCGGCAIQHLAPASYRALKLSALFNALKRVGIDPDPVRPLRLVAGDLMPPGGTAEVTLTRTESGIDVLLEAPERPRLGALEALAAFAE